MGLFHQFKRRKYWRRGLVKFPLIANNARELTEEDEFSTSLLLMMSQQESLLDGTDTFESPTHQIENIGTNSSSHTSHQLLNRYRDHNTVTTMGLTTTSSSTGPGSPTNIGSRRRTKSSSTTTASLYATIQDLPQLVHALQTSPSISCDQVGHTLRRLFALSEYTSSTMKGNSTSMANDYESLERTREQMIADGSLIPSLFHFLSRCYIEDTASPLLFDTKYSSNSKNFDENRSLKPRSKTLSHPSSMYLALLVLNNLCIPTSNKRYIAFQCHGVDILCHFLCCDPSCRMMAIVLVNLSFGTNLQFQHDLLFQSINGRVSDTELLSSLAYTLRVASLTRDGFDTRQRLFVKDPDLQFEWDSKQNSLSIQSTTSIVQQLSVLLAFDRYGIYTKSWPRQSEQMYPDTARWCICALHHLTRPLLQYNYSSSSDTTSLSLSAAMALTRTNIVPHLLCCIRIVTIYDETLTDGKTNNGNQLSLTCHTPITNTRRSGPEQQDSTILTISNNPSTWLKETSQDAALFVIMNISIDPHGRKYLVGHDIDVVKLLASIADSYPSATKTDTSSVVKTSSKDEVSDSIKVQKFQCVKARMTLAYLVGSEGHYGQEKGRIGKWMNDYIQKGHVLSMKDPFEIEQLIDILAHTLYRRTKVGPGGYSGTTFRLKYIVWAIRCLLTQPDNQEMFAGNDMEILNALLIKILAMRAVQTVTHIDAETAEYACFSLYLVSHYGFHVSAGSTVCCRFFFYFLLGTIKIVIHVCRTLYFL
jgi:hypothetical protein